MKKRWIFVLLLLAGAGAAIYLRGKSGTVAEKGPAKENPGVPVILAVAERRDMPIWLTGIGTAQASQMVTVRPRVGGALEEVNFSEGAFVKAGDVLAQIDPRPYESVLAQAEARKAQNEAQLSNAQVDAKRLETLRTQNAVSQQQLDEANATVAQLDALVKGDEAAAAAARLDLDFTTVRAPISGRTGIRLVDAGNIVTANQGDGLVVLTDVDLITVTFTIPQQHLPSITRNIGAGNPPLIVQAHSQDDDLLGEGELMLVDNLIDTSTGTLRLKAVFKNDKRTLWPGQFVKVKLLVETRKGVVVVPSVAVNPGLEGQYCYVVKDDFTVEARTVKTGPSEEEQVVIEDGLEGNEKVVLAGQNKLTPGMKVAPQESQREPQGQPQP